MEGSADIEGIPFNISELPGMDMGETQEDMENYDDIFEGPLPDPPEGELNHQIPEGLGNDQKLRAALKQVLAALNIHGNITDEQHGEALKILLNESLFNWIIKTTKMSVSEITKLTETAYANVDESVLASLKHSKKKRSKKKRSKKKRSKKKRSKKKRSKKRRSRKY